MSVLIDTVLDWCRFCTSQEEQAEIISNVEFTTISASCIKDLLNDQSDCYPFQRVQMSRKF